METSLHRALKHHYAGADGRIEVKLGNYRIDVVRSDELVEIQHAPLAAIRDKVATLLLDHRVLVVKPIVVTKHLVKRSRKRGPVTDRRVSPKRGRLLDIFDDLVHFTGVFPHARLALEILLIDIEEWRYPGHGRRRRRRANAYQIEDQKLVGIREAHRFTTATDLMRLVPTDISEPFNTATLAEALGVARWVAQQIAYCLRKTGGARVVGRRRTGLLYEFEAA